MTSILLARFQPPGTARVDFWGAARYLSCRQTLRSLSDRIGHLYSDDGIAGTAGTQQKGARRMAIEQGSRAAEMEAFYEQINKKSLDALWRHHNPQAGIDDVRAPYAPRRWRWEDIWPFMQRAAELVEPSPEDQRRVLTLNNPAIMPTHAATHTISAAVQMVLPTEVAPAHRHTMAAIRFIMKGSGAVTFVDHEPCAMNPGDLILTPGWTWHGHINQTDGPMLWMDSLDVPLVGALRQGLYEDYPDEIPPAEKPVDNSISRYGSGHMRPIWERAGAPVSPLLSFPWTETERALQNLARAGEASPFDDVAFEYTNPSTGGHVLPTIGCWIQMLRPGVHTQAHRHSSVAVYHVFRGRGASIVDGVRIEWEEGDFFSLPPYAWHEHLNASSTENAVLFSTNDIPVLESLNLYREIPYGQNGGRQQVAATYEQKYESAD
jgi:gentisate 1,2-dioxygenase